MTQTVAAVVAPEADIRFHAGLTADEWEVLLERQRGRESAAVASGRKKFQDRVREANQHGKAASTGAALTLMREITTKMEKGLREFLAVKKRGPKHTLHSWVHTLGTVRVRGDGEDTETVPVTEVGGREVVELVDDGLLDLAYIVSRAVVNLMYIEPTFRHLFTVVADNLTEELKMRRFQHQAPGLYEYKLGSFVGSTPTHMARSMSRSMAGGLCDACRRAGVVVERAEHCEHLGSDDLKIPQADKIHVGGKLVDIFVTATGMLQEKSVCRISSTKRGKQSYRESSTFSPTVEALQLLNDRNVAMESLFPSNQPMIVPPIRWAPGERGGYRFDLRGRNPFIRGLVRSYRKELDKLSMPVVYEAVNRMQETAWKINARVLATMDGVCERDGGRAGIPRTVQEPEPERPRGKWESEKERKADPRWKEWRRLMAKQYETEYRRSVAHLKVNRTMAAARDVVEESAVWFPHSLDFRGRVYPICSDLSPQGNDLEKGLLLFAEGKPLGTDGARWLALHGANALGEWEGRKLSKLTLEERVEVVEELTPRIRGIAEEPFSDGMWEDADEPWQFLAFCFEWAGYCEYRDRGQGERYISHLPVAADGTCNGLQHWAAFFADDAARVNVRPSERPEDVYQINADTVLAKVEAEADRDDIANLWLTSGYLGRKFAKTPTMTFGYGSEKPGFRGQIRKFLKDEERREEAKAHFQLPGEGGKMKDARSAACGYMAEAFWGSLRASVGKAQSGMAWMKGCARAVARESGNPVRWTVPGTGFVVIQAKTKDYFKEELKQVKTSFQGRLIFPAIYIRKEDEVNSRKQATAVAPNFIHSLDAAMLQQTVVECARMNTGMSFAMVHDSYGTHAADMTLLAKTLRETFVRMYTEQDMVEYATAQFLAQVPEGTELPEPPAKGSLDVSEVVNSLYFFS